MVPSYAFRHGNHVMTFEPQRQLKFPIYCPVKSLVDGYSRHSVGTIVTMDVVLANGGLIHFTSTSYPLRFMRMRRQFWHCKTLHLQTQSAPSQVGSVLANFASASKSADTAAKVLLQLQTFVTSSQCPSECLGRYSGERTTCLASDWLQQPPNDLFQVCRNKGITTTH